jgi:transposase InsO family protein
LLLCEAMESNQEQFAFTALERLLQERGLPNAIRSDKGVPFASPNRLFNLSRLSAWWLRLGITIKRIKPGHPQQNGRHERMHLTLKKRKLPDPPAPISCSNRLNSMSSSRSSISNARTKLYR